ncbi:hypothetical protein LGQ02_19110 [Bacillus shivajii]|uniref:hypothetical protein n=1 Tax=Bacillus shivajii TaxID=1983719 RepID=UPI001CFA63A5|nr:hypothetical protein [Bacillus shivajii]UCZ52865.1 hypothetical protein LGQ02_19110 [Bacillus shivajii]
MKYITIGFMVLLCLGVWGLFFWLIFGSNNSSETAVINEVHQEKTSSTERFILDEEVKKEDIENVQVQAEGTTEPNIQSVHPLEDNPFISIGEGVSIYELLDQLESE